VYTVATISIHVYIHVARDFAHTGNLLEGKWSCVDECWQCIYIHIYAFQTRQRQYKYAAGTCLEELARLRSRAGIASILLHPACPTAVRVASRAVIHRSCSLASPANEACPPALVVSSIIVDDIRTCTCAGLVMSCQACLGAEGATVYAVAIPLSVPCNLGHVATRVAAARRSQDT